MSPIQGKEGFPCILQFLVIKHHENGEVRDMEVQIQHIPFHLIEIVDNIEREKRLTE
jgi:hypothetical protein